MSINYRLARTAALLLAGPLLSLSHAAEPKLPREGWVSWQVPAVEGAPAWCCFSGWKEHDRTRMACKLDGDFHGISIGSGDQITDAVKIYARTTDGKIDRLQSLSASCPVETATPIQSLDVPADDSTRWLAAQVKQSGTDAMSGRPVGESALAALALHRGDAARVAAELVRLGNTDKDGGVRAKAWFWLAQTGAAESEQAIGAALRKDSDDNVREQAIFALSRLPDERATRALIAAAEDQSLSHEQRKRAVFWLSQSESSSAQAYLDKVLARIQ